MDEMISQSIKHKAIIKGQEGNKQENVGNSNLDWVGYFRQCRPYEGSIISTGSWKMKITQACDPMKIEFQG